MRRIACILCSLIASYFVAAAVYAQPLRIPYVSLSPTAGPLWIAQDAGYFKKNGIASELLYMPGGSVIIQAMVSGDVKVANMAPPAAIGAWVKGADLTLIASGVDQLLETVVTSAAIRTPADLKGKKIGVSRYGSLTDMALREALKLNHLQPDKDVTILQAGGEAPRLAALQAGAIDGAMLSGDKKVLAEKMGFHVLIDLSKLPIYYPVNGVVASKKFIATNRNAARNFLKSWVEGIKSFKTDEELALRVIGKYLKITDRDLLKKSWEIYQPAYKKIPYGDERSVKFALAQMAAEMPEAGRRKAEDFIDNSLLVELEKSGAIDQMYSHK
ncbi:MAG TPA: ABC transporter substrate-binding protein [Candidatus Binatia bacterium]|jgi:NitT/TauT family transport system substrate-binding protein